MKRLDERIVAIVLTLMVVAAGCHPTQPFYLHEDGDLSHYVDTATAIEHPDVQEAMLEEVRQAHAPLTLSDAEFENFRDVSLEDCVSIALQNSKIIRNLSSLTQFTIADGLVGRTAATATVYDPAIFEADPQFGVEAALSNFDAQFTTQVFMEHTDRPQNFGGFTGQAIFSNFFRQDQGQFSAALTKQTAAGTTYAVRNQTTYTGNNNPSRGIPSDWLTVFEAEARQPIARGRGTQVNRVPIVIARIRTDIALADFEASVRNMLLDLENTYWDLNFNYRLLETAKIGRDSALGTWTTANATLAGGKDTVQDEARAREQYFFFRSQMETALRDVFAAETRLRWLMGLASTDGELLRPVDRPTMARVEFDWREIHSESLVRNAELRRERWLIKQREQELIAARNQLLPQLDIVATYRWLGQGDQLLNASRNGRNFINTDPNNANRPLVPGVPLGAPTPGSTAFDELTEGRFQEFRLGLEFTPPRIGARREQAGVRFAQLQYVREKARLEDMELNVSHLLTSAVQNLDYNYHVAQTHFNRWVAAENEVEVSSALFEGGAATIDRVLDAHRRRSQAQADFYRAIVEYNKAIANVHFRKGSLMEYNNIQLGEGPWPKKAYWDALGHARERDASYYFDYGWTRPRVISRGPVDGTEGPAIGESWDGEVIEEVTTPATAPGEMLLELPDGPTTSVDPRASTILDAPTVNLADNPPNELVQRMDQSDFEWGELGLGGVTPVSHEAAQLPGEARQARVTSQR